MQVIGKYTNSLSVIPNNYQKYMAFMVGKQLVFIDSFQFMSTSLDKLVNNTPELKYTKLELCNNNDNDN